MSFKKGEVNNSTGLPVGAKNKCQSGEELRKELTEFKKYIAKKMAKVPGYYK